MCASCAPGYYTTTGLSCILCPSGCSTCTSYVYNSQSYVNCTACSTGAVLTGPAPYTCQCGANQYMSTATTPATCVTCAAVCAGCTATGCLACSSGYYLSGSSCLACMPVCSTCSTGTTCTACLTGLTLNSVNVCVCPSPTLLNPTTKVC